MAMGGEGQRQATSAIAACRPFKNSTGSLRGTQGTTRRIGWLAQSPRISVHRLAELLERAVYVVWSYDTPIGFVHEAEDGERTAYYIDVPHSVTTSHHQTLCRVGFGDYETLGTGPQERRPRRSRPDSSAEIRRANATVQGYASGDAMVFSAQDDLMEEVHGYVHPAHP